MRMGTEAEIERVGGEIGSGQSSSSYEEVTILYRQGWFADDLSRLLRLTSRHRLGEANGSWS
jgi:hypothetical protein